MIRYSNGFEAEHFVASGALSFDGKGWLWEWPLRWVGLIDTSLFAVVMKTVTKEPRKGNLRWWCPWRCVRLIPGGSVNKVGLTNKGIEWWARTIGPTIRRDKISMVGSIYGSGKELVDMAIVMNDFDLVALEINDSCPNTGHPMEQTETIVANMREVAKVSRHPLIYKGSVAQETLTIARHLVGVVEAFSFNSVPWEIAFPRQRSPLWRLEAEVGGGGGGVSGVPAQKFNWPAMHTLHRLVPEMPLIASSIVHFDDIAHVRSLGAAAESFGVKFLRAPWAPTLMVRRDIREHAAGSRRARLIPA